MEEGTYFRELARYIHLNPLRAGLVSDLPRLDRYPWQDRAHVLAWFGGRRAACRAYRAFLRDGLPQGRHPELVVGGLIRSLGGWAEVRSMRRRAERVRTGPRPALLAHPLRRSRLCGFLVAGHARNQGEQSARCD